MKANKKFRNMPPEFWASVRLISQEVGYTIRGRDKIKVPTINEILRIFTSLGLDKSLVMESGGNPTKYCIDIIEYYKYRADILYNYVKPRLMTLEQVEHLFNDMINELNPSCKIPMNKQKGEKKAPAYFTGIINMILEKYTYGNFCDFDPKKLTIITHNSKPVRTLARRVDGAFPAVINPIAIWEIKEYYYTTTFGSRVADGIYETLLDGMELNELHEHEGIKIFHYLMVDAYYTWWKCGKPYLCRIIDMLHMGYVDEVLFGREVVERLPKIILGWISIMEKGKY